MIGPPGAGKTSYCHGMSLFTESLGRKCAIVNLDFANDCIPYIPTIDVRSLISQQVKLFTCFFVRYFVQPL